MRPTYVKLSPTTVRDEGDDFCVVMRGRADLRRERAWLDLEWFLAERRRRTKVALGVVLARLQNRDRFRPRRH